MSELAKALRRLRDERFGGNLTDTAKALGINHGYLSQAISGRTGCGKKLCLAYAAFTGTSIDETFRMAEGPKADPAEAAPVEIDVDELCRRLESGEAADLDALAAMPDWADPGQPDPMADLVAGLLDEGGAK